MVPPPMGSMISSFEEADEYPPLAVPATTLWGRQNKWDSLHFTDKEVETHSSSSEPGCPAQCPQLVSYPISHSQV